VIEVSIVKHLTHRETAIPDCWEGLSVAVVYRRLCPDDEDYTDLMIRKMASAEPHHDPQYVAQFKNAYESELRALGGITRLYYMSLYRTGRMPRNSRRSFKRSFPRPSMGDVLCEVGGFSKASTPVVARLQRTEIQYGTVICMHGE
jgi:hypothetical protein